MREWKSYTGELLLKNGQSIEEYTIQFKTTEYEVYKRIEKFFQDLIDESSSCKI